MNNVAHQLCDAFEASRRADDSTGSIPNGFVVEDDERKYEIQKPLWILTVYWLIYRNLLIVVRDPSIQKIRILQKIVSFSRNVSRCVFVAYKCRDLNLILAGNRNNGWTLIFWHDRFGSIRHPIGSRGAVHTHIRKYLCTNVFSAQSLPQTRSVVHTRATGRPLRYVSVLSNECRCAGEMIPFGFEIL